MKIQILCFGKLAKNFYLAASQDYEQRLSNYCELKIVELKEATMSDSLKNQKNDAQNLLSHLNKLQDYEIYFLDVASLSIDSLKFAQLIEVNKNQKSGKICFVIGPSTGYDSEIKKLYPCFSFGPITMPHQLFRIVLLEQIYRSFKIINHQTYHK